ncbi:hypothetical protein SH580_12615 [Coraliomargarita algicola]|uniref:DUF3458 domain-containing protein n=1 Tax=Coraliomargarita algicola TaxID=3092156 RepID=A0ABZ0RFJ8_9BACT|nr:hypothetical protein [Coraliomargarita sp. J2-16]WPJ94278.1 hypothetical protein SH580_12615 [Coraliomargarita sp. J2-16]
MAKPGRAPQVPRSEPSEPQWLPADFWQLSPAESMRLWIDQSRSAAHRAKFDLVLEPTEAALTPLRLSLDDSPSQCYSTGSRHYYVSFADGDAYFASGQVRTPGGARLYDAVFSPTKYELTFATLDASMAQAVSARIGSLPQIQVEYRQDYERPKRSSMSSAWSSADGRGYLQLWATAAPDMPIVWSGTLWNWGVELAKRINFKIDQEVRLNYANSLLTRVLPQHVDLSSAETDEAIEATVLAILNRYVADASAMSQPVVQIAVEVAGERGVAVARSQIESILSDAALPASDTSALLAEKESLQQAIWAIAPKLKDYGVRYGQSTSHIPEAQVLIEQRALLLAQLKAIEVSVEDQERFSFRQSLQGALLKLELAEDVDALKTWVLEERYGARWALRRLHAHYPAAYAEVLESSLQRGDHQEPGEVLNRIYIADRARGVRLAQQWIDTTDEDALFVDCFQILQRADAMPDESAQVARLIRLIRADYTNNYLRARALNLLVPQKEPMRYTDLSVDAALLYVIDPKANGFPDPGYNYTNASINLIERDAARYYPLVMRHVDLVKMPHQKEHFLVQLASYAEELRPEDRQACFDWVRKELRFTQSNVNSLLWIVWRNDWRILTPELRAMATESVGEEESEDAVYGNTETRAISGRFHLARQILALWSEPDPMTCAKLYIAFAYQHGFQISTNGEGRSAAPLRATFLPALARLDAAERAELVDYSSWCQQQAALSSVKKERITQLHANFVHMILER